MKYPILLNYNHEKILGYIELTDEGLALIKANENNILSQGFTKTFKQDFDELLCFGLFDAKDHTINYEKH